MRFSLFFFLIGICVFTMQGQEEPKIKPMKIGFLYAHGSNENFFHDDPDYTYSSESYKGQFFYSIGEWKNINFELIVQPQIQFLNHQLINEQYITPDQEDYQEKRREFTKPKTFNIYALEFGVSASKQILSKLAIETSISLGFSFVNKRTERLAKGFTFIENFSLGLNYTLLKNQFIYFGGYFGHVSNLDINKPNDGYNSLGYQIGYRFIIY